MRDPASNLSHLSENPGDWEIRIRAIEDFIRVDDLDSARRLVRESPEDAPTPAHLQYHLHSLLTRGKAALPPMEEGAEEREYYGPVAPREKDLEVKEELPSSPKQEIEEQLSDELEESEAYQKTSPAKVEDKLPTSGASLTFEDLVESSKVPAESQAPKAPEKEREQEQKKKAESKPKGAELSGGLAALLEDGESGESDGEQETKEAPLPALPPAIKIDRDAARRRWENYDGDLNLTLAEYAPPTQRSSALPERFSAVTLAIMFHLVLIVLVSLVVIHTPRPKPPQLVLSIPHEREVLLTTTRITKPTTEMKPAAASAQAVNVISSISNSSFTLPEIEDTENYKITSMITGLQPTGQGMSFSTEATKETDINFFGISGGGKKIVFVIDATPEMLIDEKGGMTAYDKVKNEVAAMLASLNRGTHFNVLLYQGKNLVAFREKPVPGLPSNLRLAIEWMDPLNRDYERLGLGRSFGESLNVTDVEDLPIRSADVSHYTKAIQLALEWRVSAVFCISNGYARMNRSPTEEMLKKMAENPPTPGTPGTVNPGEAKAWQSAVAKTRAWLQKENAARAEKGISPKVVTNFNGLVREITGATPPRRTGGTPASGGAQMPNLPPVTPEEIEFQVKKLVDLNYKKESREEPSVHMVLFLAEDEDIGEMEGHFKNLVRKNRGKLKILNGLAALENVTE